MINICNNIKGSSVTMLALEVLMNPHHDVILESTFYHLVEKIRGNQLMDVCTGKSICKRLQNKSETWGGNGMKGVQ